jgi:hypothetical protein
MDLPLHGGCFCGAVRYEISAAPYGQANCHCRACQHATGGAYAPVLLVPAAGFRVAGPLRHHVVLGASGNRVARAFCERCGTTLYAHTTRVETMRPVYAVTLDRPEIFCPELDCWVEAAQLWVAMDPTLPKFPRDPPARLAGIRKPVAGG